MITYISSPYINTTINLILEEGGQTVMNAITDTKFDIDQFVKQQMQQIQATQCLIIDLDALEKDDAKTFTAIKNFRLLYNTKLIVIGNGRQPGDELLSDILHLGIYNIINLPKNNKEEDEALLKEELRVCLTGSGKDYKDSARFESIGDLDRTQKGGKQQPATKEKIIIKNEIQKTASKVLVGFMGTGPRMGTTHNAIVGSCFLKEKGNKVALVEAGIQGESCFAQIRESFDETEDHGEHFTLNQVDFYPSYNLEKTHLILARNYNFVVIDFGRHMEENLAEFNRCVVRVIVSGSKPWEINWINKVFESMEEDSLKDCAFLFNYTSPSLEKTLRENMGELDKAYVADMTPDPFNQNKAAHCMEKIFVDYMPTQAEAIKRKPGILGKLLRKTG